MNAFATLFEFSELEKRNTDQANADRDIRRAAIEDRRKAIFTDWLKQVMVILDIPADVQGTWVAVEGFRFTIAKAYDKNEPYPLRGSIHNAMMARSLDELEAVDFKDGCFDLVIENTHIGEEYRARRPDMNRPFSDYQESLRVKNTTGPHFPLVVAEALKKLMKSAEDAALNKATIEANWLERQQQIATQEAEAKVENERLDREWNERVEREETERIQQREAREAKESALRMEVAQRFGVSTDAFEYLIESLVDEIARRRNASIEDEY